MSAIRSAPFSTAVSVPRPRNATVLRSRPETLPPSQECSVFSEPAESVQASMVETRAGLGELSFPAINPFAASVAANVWSEQHGTIWGRSTINVMVPGRLRYPLPIEVSFTNGPDAPMALILPGIGGEGSSAHVSMLAKQALDHGMNYTVMPNPWSNLWLSSNPEHDPGNLPWESQATREVLEALRTDYPKYYDHVSAVGYSYGALLGAALVADQATDTSSRPLINGGLVAISPPENLIDSMECLDHLRTEYHDTSDWRSVSAKYAAWVDYYGYDRVLDSPIATRENRDVEKFLADTVASRQHQQQVIRYTDLHDGLDLLPLNHEIAVHGPILDKTREKALRQAQDKAVQDSTFGQYADIYLAPCLIHCKESSSLDEMAEQYSFSHLLTEASGHGVPVMTLSAADDYILQPENVATFRALEANPAPDQAMRVLDHGGHVGVLFNPQAREQIMHFLAHPPPTSG